MKKIGELEKGSNVSYPQYPNLIGDGIMSIGCKEMTREDYTKLRKGYCLIAAKCIWDHFQLYKSLNNNQKEILKIGQIHTRLLETIVPDPFIIQYASQGYIKAMDKDNVLYREHIVPCGYLLKKISDFFEKDKDYTDENYIRKAADIIEDYLAIAIITKEEAKVLDQQFKNTMPEKEGTLFNDSGSFKLSRFSAIVGSNSITLKPLKWEAFIGGVKGFDQSKGFRLKGHKFIW